MTPEEAARAASLAAAQAADLKGLDLLYDYTKFHIGVYLTLASSFITVASVKLGERFALNLNRRLVWTALAFFMLAGLAGGVIVSSITQCFGVGPGQCSSSASFLKNPHGPWNGEWFTLSGKWWTYVEHTSFWAGLMAAAASFGLQSRTPVEAAPLPTLSATEAGSSLGERVV
jgi:hypothetical protein